MIGSGLNTVERILFCRPADLSRRGDAVDALIGKVHATDGTARNYVGGTAILVHARADIDPWGRGLGDPAVRGTSHQRVTSALSRASLQPVDVVTVERHSAKTQSAASHIRSRQR